MKLKFAFLLILTLSVITSSIAQEQMVVGRRYDTGKKWTDGSVIYKKLVSFGALPNTTTKSVAHSESLSLTKYAVVSRLIARDGTTYLNIPAVTITSITITATNITMISTNNLSTYTGWVEIEFCL